MLIESLQNEKIKNIQRLSSDNRFRKKSGLFVVEGKQENERALQFHFEPHHYFVCEDIYDGDFPKGNINLVTEKIYDKIAYRGSSEGIIGVYKIKNTSLKNFVPQENSSVIVVESVEKPGNLGAILRTCEAFGIDALIIADPKVDFYNPNVIRSSVGCLFGMKIFQSNNEEIFEFLLKNKFQVFSTFMDESAVNISEKNLKGKSALLFGTEHSGLSEFWLNKGENILVPMAGSIDSLNLSNAVAICCYEILRQKLKK
ncbi:TrmH family RNA methyltransferase [Chryseobacterium sp. MP_3.2]|uniref:TrmH family RNA methyltransferase n=1 Tax=Chryseobacterium sp. MP_3.2 TaxID=3071712 RepID=UPI002E0853E7|nr:TrmH family RNA methyltransferase [Chryseobacterium sp. MP_3.2]